MEVSKKKLDDAVSLKSTNRDLKRLTMQSQLRNKLKRIELYLPTREVEYDGIHTKPLNL